METWEIIVLIIFLILLAIGIGVTIYFVVRYEEDQKKKTQGPTGISPPTGPTGNTGATGPSGSTGSIPANFSISPASNPNLYMTYIPSSSTVQVVTTNGSSLDCTDYRWQLINNGRNPSLLSVIADPTNVSPYSSPTNLSNDVGATFTGNAILSNSGFTPENMDPTAVLNWRYTSDKRWCGTGIRSNYCLYHNSDNTVSVNNYTNADPNFIWDLVPLIGPPICTP